MTPCTNAQMPAITILATRNSTMEKAYQMNPTHDTAAVTATKLTVVWAGVAVGMTEWDWGTVAAVLASIYSAILIVEKVARLLAAFLSRGRE